MNSGSHARRERQIELRREAVARARVDVNTGHGFHVEDYAADLDLVAALGVDDDGDGPLIEYVSESDPERVWGPRPRLMPAESGGRRTVVITGHTADRQLVSRSGSRASSLPASRAFHAGDRTAMWAVLLGVMLLIVAISSAH
ncbi:hypothetical protein [Conexibacter sp. DBS9H8]|uniref:hypothetical protein n=1 Tax=Conexibacter sp. DBS9H8 TaxID=2937801 RepID=UPI00200E26E4|nr:hypothetical protein [Conexibacter sp. DBS9H8]